MASYNGTDSGQLVSEEYLRDLKRKVGKQWKDVGRCLGISDAKLDYLEEDNNKNVEETIYQMLLYWKKKSGAEATYANLEEALVRSKGQMLPEDSLSSSSDKSGLLISNLKKTYEKWLRTARPNPMKKAQKWRLEDLFMDLGIALQDQTYSSNEQYSWKSLKTFTALFENPVLKEKASKIIIEGDPGSGKTTLMYYLAYLWCNNDKIMEGMKFFVLLPLRKVKPGTSIGKVIKDVLLRASGRRLTETDIQAILQDESCMILALDGLDEYPGLKMDDHEETDIMAIIRDESEYVSPTVKVILTTRPSGLPYIHDCDVKRVRLEKLKDIHRKTYLKKVFPGEEDEERRSLILKTIHTNYFIRDYCNLPLWFTLIVQIMRDGLQRNKGIKLDCLSEFFKYILRGLRGHHVNKDKQDQGDIDSPKLEEIAFNGLLKDSLKQIWNKQDLAEVENYDALVEIGILVEEEDVDSDSDFLYSDASMAPKTVTFLHRTFQEWYGAKYLAKLSQTPGTFTPKLEKAISSVNTSHLLYFTCAISPQAAIAILNYHLLEENQRYYDYNFLCRCILEYNGNECELKKIVKNLCAKEEMLQRKDMFAILSRDDTFFLKSKLAVFRLAYTFENTINHIDLQCDDMTASPPDKIMTRRNIEIPPLSAKVITVHKCYGQPFFNFLRKCYNLETLRIDSDTFPGTPQEIQKWLQGMKIEVFWKIHKPVNGMMQDKTYQIKDYEWKYVKEDYYRHCRNCREPIVGLFWECRNCDSFYLCDDCKEKGFHKNHSHRLGREFDERELLLAETPEEEIFLQLPFVKMRARERYMIVCSGCKEADVTLVGFECKTCVNFHLCKLCKNNFPHNHDLIKRVYHIFWRCSSCNGKIYGSRFKSKRWRGCIFCETCYMDRRNFFQAFEEIKEPEYFRDVNCVECGIDMVLLYRCDTCGGRNLCILCQAKPYHEKHKIEEIQETEVYHIFWRCSSCKGKIYGSRFKSKRWRGCIFCEKCYMDRRKFFQEFEEIKEPEEFKLRRCENCKVTGEMNKVWFRCETCDCFLLCERCKDEGFHREHNFIRQYFRDVNCDQCGIDTVLMYRCNTCGGCNLCIRCQAKLYHKNHEIEEIEETEIKHDGFRCANCRNQIFGIRYQCPSCVYEWGTFNLCKSCKDKGVHSDQHSFESGRENPICSYCLTKVNGPGFGCKRCTSYTICEDCNNKGIHINHELKELHEEEVLHIGVECKICLKGKVYGSRFKCTTCSGYDICQECEYKGLHSEHTLIEMKHAELYHDMQCDRCHAGIHDVRYKCKKCKKYNICKYCITEDSCTGHEIVKSEYDQAHCTRCYKRIIGPSYLCDGRKCYRYLSVCEDCKLILTNGINCKHEFVELRKKDVQHKFIHCNLCKKYQFRGTRYRCMTCKWYNLCEDCKECGHHKHHEFDEWKTSQFLPGPGNFKITTSTFEKLKFISNPMHIPSRLRLPYIY